VMSASVQPDLRAHNAITESTFDLVVCFFGIGITPCVEAYVMRFE
jgi:hypothetical protein